MLMNSSALVGNDYLVTSCVRDLRGTKFSAVSLVPDESMNFFAILQAPADCATAQFISPRVRHFECNHRPSAHRGKAHNYSRVDVRRSVPVAPLTVDNRITLLIWTKW